MHSPLPPHPRIAPLMAFTGLYLLTAGLVSWLRGNQEFIFYIVVMIVLIFTVSGVHKKVGFSGGLLWALSLWGLAHMAGGLIPLPAGWPYHGDQPVLYSAWLIPQRLKYDQLVHAYGFGITTWLCWQSMRSLVWKHHQSILRPTLGVLTLCAAAGMGFGALNEVVEFIAVMTIPNTNVGGYENTGWDLVANLIGCLIAAVLLRTFASKNAGTSSGQTA